MKLTCLQENLKKGLSIVNHLKSSNISLPILNNVLIKATKGKIVLTTTDLEIGIKTVVRGKVEKEGEFTIPIQLFSNYINLLPNKQVKIEAQKDFLLIKCENYFTKIKGIPASEFPLIPKVEKKEKFSFKIKELKKAIHQVNFVVNPSEMRTEISGVLFNFNAPKEGFTTLVGTDSYRLAEKIVEFNNFNNKENKKIIVPLKTLQELLNILEDGEEEIEIYLSENQILFFFNETELISRLINGEYPNYKQIIPEEFKIEAKTSIDKLIQAIKGTGLFSRSGINDIDLDFNSKDNEIIISSSNSEIGESTSKVEADISGENGKITFNYRYLLDGLQNLEDEEVVMKISDSKSPGLIKSIKDENYIYIVMPIGS